MTQEKSPRRSGVSRSGRRTTAAAFELTEDQIAQAKAAVSQDVVAAAMMKHPRIIATAAKYGLSAEQAIFAIRISVGQGGAT